MAWLSLEELKKYDAKEELKKMAKAKQTNTAEKSAVKSVSEGKNIPDTNLFKGLTVSKPERKKLSGSDSDVFKRARTLVTDTSLTYAEKKKQIDQAQKELGRIRDKHLIASMMGDENAKKTIRQVSDLQNQLSQQLKSTAFGAGFGQAAGLDIYDTAVKKIAEKTGNTSLSQRMAAQDEVRAQVKAANEKSYGRGELAGELTQQAILYRTAGAVAERAVLAGMGKLIGGKNLGKAGTFATRMLGQQAADTVVNTPLTIAKGVEEGKDRGEIAKDVGKQVVMDAAFNLGMGAIGAGAKAAGKAIGKAKESKAAVKTAREEAQREISATTGMKDGKEVTRYTNPALDKNPLEMEGVKELLNDSEFDMMDADATDYSAALGIKPINWTANKDFYRVMEEAGSLDPAAKEMLENELVAPVKTAKDSYVTFEKNFFRDVLPVVQKTGIRRGTKESAAAQWYREGERLNAMGKKEPYSLAKLKQEFPDKWQDIIELDEVLQKWLKSMPAPLNENFKKIYPNVEANAVAEMKKHQLASEDFFKKARAEQERIDALEKRLGELKRQTAKDGTRKKADLEKSIINKERQIEKAKAEKERLDRNAASHSKKAKKWEDDITNGDIYENKRLLIRENYYPHMTKRERGFKGLKAIGEMNQNIDPRLEGISEFTQPKTKWAGFMQHRKEGYYDADALGNTIDYMQQAGYKLYFDPVIANNRKVIKGIAEATKDSRNANGLLNFLTQYTNDLAGKTNPYFDRMLTNIGGNGRKVIAGLEWLNNRVKSNAVMGNFRSMTAQVFNIPNAMAYVKNPAAWSRGAKIMGDMVTGRNGAKELMESSTFLSERYTLDKLLNQFEEKNIGNSVERLASWMMTVGDEFATRLIWASAYSDAAKKGVTDAVRYADDIARKAVGGRGIGEMPILQKSRVYKFAVPFSLEVNNSFQVLKETVAKKDLAGLALMMGASYAMNSIPRELFGFDVSTDFVNALKEGLDAWDDEEQTFAENLTGVTGRLAGELISAIPSGAILSTLAFDEYKREKFFGDADPTRYGVGQVGVTTLTDPILDIMSGEDASGSLAHAAFSILPNVGGKTLERAYEGLQDMAVLPDVTLGGENGVSVQQRKTAGSYKDNGELRFPIESTPGNIAKLFAFGEYATKEGKRYLEDTNSTLSANQTETYEKLVAAGAKNTIAFETISRIKAKEKSSEKRSAIRSSMLSDEQKAILYYELVAEKDSKDRQTLDWYDGRTSRPQVADALSRMAEYSGNDMAKRSVLRNSDLSESDKRYLYLNNVLNEASVEIETERLDAAQSVDIDINTYFTIRNKYSRLKEQGGKVKNNWISWMRSEGYSGRQIYVMGEAFGWNMD